MCFLCTFLTFYAKILPKRAKNKSQRLQIAVRFDSSLTSCSGSYDSLTIVRVGDISGGKNALQDFLRVFLHHLGRTRHGADVTFFVQRDIIRKDFGVRTMAYCKEKTVDIDVSNLLVGRIFP